MFHIAYFELKKVLRDWRWLLIFLFEPIVIVILMGMVAYHHPKDIPVSIGIDNQTIVAQELAEEIEKEKELKIQQFGVSTVRERLAQNKDSLGVVLNIDNNFDGRVKGSIDLIENVTTPEVSGYAKAIVLNSIQDKIRNIEKEQIESAIRERSGNKSSSFLANLPELNLNEMQSQAITTGVNSLRIINLPESSAIELNDIKNSLKEIKYFDFYASGIVLLLVLIMGLDIASVLITQERMEGTLERFFVTPYSKFQLVMGKMLAFSVISVFLTFATIITLKLAFNVSLGYFNLVLLITFLNSLAAISLGILISALTKTVAESIQVATMVFFAVILLSTFLFQDQSMHPYMQKISLLIPFTHSIQALREVNLLDFGIKEVAKELIILGGSTILFLTASVVFLKRRNE